MARKPATKSSRTSSKSTAKRRKSSADAKPDYSNYDADQLSEFYRDMLEIRRFEEKAGQMYGMGLIGGFCHLYIGQEAVVVGMTQAGTSDDSVITSYRDHGHMLACGMDPKGVMAELTGRRGGYSKGKGGSLGSFRKLGTLLFLTTEHPTVDGTGFVAVRRLMVAQDTGSAIKGVVRGDVFWGFGPEAESRAGLMNEAGIYYLLLPRKPLS